MADKFSEFYRIHVIFLYEWSSASADMLTTA